MNFHATVLARNADDENPPGHCFQDSACDAICVASSWGPEVFESQLEHFIQTVPSSKLLQSLLVC